MLQNLRDWLFTAPTLPGIVDPFAVVYGAVFVAGFVLSSYVAGPPGEQIRAESHAIDAMRWARVGMAIFGTGLVFFGTRLLQINPLGFGAPIWMVVSLGALVVAAVRFSIAWRAAHEEKKKNAPHLLGAGRS